MRMVQDDVIEDMKRTAMNAHSLDNTLKDGGQEPWDSPEEAYLTGQDDGRVELARQLLQRMGVSYGQ